VTIDKIYIENFGKLTDITVVPTGGLNIIYAPNESGKSTFLSFIKYMFYGTKMKKVKGDMTFKERYMPWNGMPMSGSIEFTHSGKKYIISRTDGAKNGSRRLEVKELLTGTPLNIDDPGRYFFSVGEKAFSDSCFVTDIFSVTDSDDDILTLLSDSGADNASYTRVREALEEKILSLSSTKRSSSQLSVLNRLLNEEQAKQLSIRKEMSDITVSRSSFDNKTELLKVEIKRLDDLISKENSVNISIRYHELCKTLNSEMSNMQNLTAQLSSLTDEREEKNKILNPSVSFFSFVVFVGLAFLSAVLFRNVSFLVPFLGCAFISFVHALSSWIRKRRSDKKSSRNLKLEHTISEQIELSSRRIDDIKASVSELEASYPDILQNKNSNSVQTNFFTTDELNDIITRREKCAAELKALEMRAETLAKRYSQLSFELDACEFSVSNLNIRISEVTSKLELYRTAMLILDTSFSVLRDEFAPKLCTDAFEILSSITDGNCTALVSNEHFEASVKINNEYKDVRFLSDGTQALVYLAIRIAVSGYLSPGDDVPVFFDDVLSGFDDERCQKMMNALGDLSHSRQIFLCTCRSREAKIPPDSKNASLVSIRKDDTNGQC